MLKAELFSMLNRDRFSEYLPYLAYSEDDSIYINKDNSIGFVLELSPVPYAGDSQVNALSSIYELDWGKKSVLQVILFADPDQDKVLKRYKELRKRVFVSKFLENWSERFCDYLWEHRHKGVSSEIMVPFRNFRVFFVAKMGCNLSDIKKETLKLKSLRDSVRGALKSAHIDAIDVKADEFIYILHRIINLGRPYGEKVWDWTKPICNQVVEGDLEVKVEGNYLRVNDWYVKVKTPRVYCPEPTTYKINLLLGDLISGGNQMQIPCPFMIVLNILPKSANAKLQGMANFVAAQKAAVKLAPRLMKKKQEYFEAVDRIEEGEKFLYAYMSVVLFADEKERLDSADKLLEACWSKQQFLLQDEKWLNLPLFLYALPFGPYVEGAEKLGRFEPVDTKTLGICSPLQADWRGTGTPVLPFVSRRGQIMMFDLWDSNTNYNCLIAAQSGAGKSFLVNYIVLNYLSIGGYAYIIDIGGSYKKICQMMGGQYIQFSHNSNISLNIFSLLNLESIDIEDENREVESENDLVLMFDEDTSNLFIMLVNILGQMIKPREALTDYEKKVLINALIKAIQIAKKRNRLVDIDLIIEVLEQDSMSLEQKQMQDRRKADYAEMLKPYSSTGIYGKWFRGPLNLDFNNRFVVLELEELNNIPDLREVVLLMVMGTIESKLYFGDRSIPKLIIIDEAWQLMRGGNTASFIEHGYRRARKYGGSYITITQSIMDFFREDNAGVGQAIISSSAFKFLLIQKQEDVKRAVQENKLVLSDFESKLIETIHTIKGSYSEIFVKTDDFFGVGRLYVDKFSQYLFNTSPEVVQFLENKMKEGLSLEEAIMQAMERGISLKGEKRLT